MKMTVLYHSKSGNTKQMAMIIAEGMQSVDRVEARAFSIDEVDEEFLRESRCVVLGTPSYLADMSAQVKTWLDSMVMKGALLAGKLGGAFATADYLYGGGELAVQSILSHFNVFGMLTYSGGGAFGKPVIHLGPVALGGKLEESRETFFIYGKRMAMKTVEVFG